MDAASSTLAAVERFRSRRPDRRPSPPPLPANTSDAEHLLTCVDELLSSAQADVDEAQSMVQRYGKTCEAEPIVDGPYRTGIAALNTTLISSTSQQQEEACVAASKAVAATTGGHSNTDHIITRSGCPRVDKLAELQRGLKRRARTMVPESLGQDRWDSSTKIKGSRRRRIKGDANAPPEPPPSGYVTFVGQMTCKIRHDRPNERHSQVKVIGEISSLWKSGLSKAERERYDQFATEAQTEYRRLFGEYCATGSYSDTSQFLRLGSSTEDAAQKQLREEIRKGASSISSRGPWVRRDPAKRNALEQELCEYDTVIFPQRPAEVDQPEWEKQREEASKRHNAQKSKAESNGKGKATSGKAVRKKRKVEL